MRSKGLKHFVCGNCRLKFTKWRRKCKKCMAYSIRPDDRHWVVEPVETEKEPG